MPSRFSISLATVVMLVVLRVSIGWHFFSEGVKHYADPNWTSAPVLRAAKGPLAPLYHSYLDDFHGFDEYLHASVAPKIEDEVKAVAEWKDRIQKDWDAQRGEFLARHKLDEPRQQKASQIFHHFEAKLGQWIEANKEALTKHVHQWHRKEKMQDAPASDLPFETKRLAAKRAELGSESAPWLAELTAMENDYRETLEGLLSDEELQANPPQPQPSSIRTVDRVMTYAILGIGLLLVLGLLTRTACVAGALFLLSVVMMQPFWVSETAPTFNQYVEMFALLTLATTQVGRWAGLDFFLSKPTSPRGLPSKGISDASHE